MLADDNADGPPNAPPLNASVSLKLAGTKELTVFLNTTNSSRMNTCVLVFGSINASNSGRQSNSKNTCVYLCVYTIYLCLYMCV